MGAPEPLVRIEAPLPPSAGGLALVPPVPSEASGAVLRTFEAWKLPTEGAAVVVGCLSTPVPGWVEEMRQPVMARAEAWTAKLAEKVAGVPVELRGDGEVRKVHEVTAGPKGSARTFLTFEHEGRGARVVTCGIACAGEDRAKDTCEAVVRGSRVVGGSAPPAPTAGLAALSWAVRHPAPTAGATAGAAAALLLALVLFRRRPRSRPF